MHKAKIDMNSLVLQPEVCPCKCSITECTSCTVISMSIRKVGLSHESQLPRPTMAASVDSLSSLFPLTQPVPNVVTHPGLLPLNELALELDLIRSGSSNITRWVHHIANVTATVNAAEKLERGSASESEAALLGSKLSTKAGRHGLQRLTDLYERALAQFPQSYKLWKQYLDMRCSYVLGSPKRKVNLRAPKKKRAGNVDGEDDNGGTSLFLKYLNEGVKDVQTGETGEELSDSERDVDADWSNGLDGVVGAEEWRALAGTFERAIMWQARVCPGRTSRHP